eukprot:1150682-Pelagomonas_calceolata.AAC.3
MPSLMPAYVMQSLRTSCSLCARHAGGTCKLGVNFLQIQGNVSCSLRVIAKESLRIASMWKFSCSCDVHSKSTATMFSCSNHRGTMQQPWGRGLVEWSQFELRVASDAAWICKSSE